MTSLVTLHNKDEKQGICHQDFYMVCVGSAGVVFCRVSREKCECGRGSKEGAKTS